MREYDDHIRPYRPVLRRIIIVMVVVTAVPVMLWSVTAFVRSYVAQPKAPTFRPLATTALIEPSESAATDSQQDGSANPGRLVVEARATATDARSSPTVSFKKPAADPSPDGDAKAANAPQVAAAINAAPATAAMPSSPAVMQPMPPPMIASPATNPGATVWPDPPKFAPSNGAFAVQPPPVADDATAEALPAAKPITGRIPLPPHRPRLFAMAQPAAVSASIPVPRPRPVTAPEVAPVAVEVPVVDRLMIH